jgi:hypothetical protein
VEEVYQRSPAEAIVAVASWTRATRLPVWRIHEVLRYARGLRRKRWERRAATVSLSRAGDRGPRGRYRTWLRPIRRGRDTVVPVGAAEAAARAGRSGRGPATRIGRGPLGRELLVFEVLAPARAPDGVSRGLQAQYAIHRIAEELRRAGAHRSALEPHAYAFGAGRRAHEEAGMSDGFVGAGIGYRRAAPGGAALVPSPGRTCSRIMPEHFYAHPEELDALAERYPLVFHCVGLSIGPPSMICTATR